MNRCFKSAAETVIVWRFRRISYPRQALGVRNIMVISGVETRFGDHPQARIVNDLDLMELIRAIQTLQKGKRSGRG